MILTVCCHTLRLGGFSLFLYSVHWLHIWRITFICVYMISWNKLSSRPTNKVAWITGSSNWIYEKKSTKNENRWLYKKGGKGRQRGGNRKGVEKSSGEWRERTPPHFIPHFTPISLQVFTSLPIYAVRTTICIRHDEHKIILHTANSATYRPMRALREKATTV